MRIDEVLAQENAGGEVLWAIADHQGSVKVILDNQGNVVNNITYDSFGNVTVETNAGTSFRFTYTARELDPETGNYYYRSRFLDPLTGGFIQEDKIGFAGGDSNLYRYVGNSPLIYTDPSGNIPAPVVMFAAGFMIDSAIQIAVNRGFDNYDWKQATMTGLSTAIGGAVTGGILKAGTASLGKRIAVNALVSGVVDGGLQLGRNALEGKCDPLEDVAQQTIVGAIGGAGGELAEAGIKAGVKAIAPHVKNLVRASGDAAGNLYKGANGLFENVSNIFNDSLIKQTDTTISNLNKSQNGNIDYSFNNNAANINSRYGVNKLKTGKLIREMGKSDIGQFVLDKAKANEIDLIVSTDTNVEKTLLGEASRSPAWGNEGVVYAKNTQSYQQTAIILIHEGMHALGIGGSRRAEAIVRLASEYSHQNLPIDRQAMRKVLTDMRATGAYNHLSWKVGKESNNFPGIKF